MSINANLLELRCIRCEMPYQLNDSHIDGGLGCSRCMTEGFPSGLYCVYKSEHKLSIDETQHGMRRFLSRLPYTDFPTLGEGGTALVSLPALASQMRVAQLTVKTEGQNPTGSHKDRMSPLAVARAVAAGFSKVVASSSGNAGASLASYAARAGLQCCIIADHDISAPWADAIQLTGAHLLKVNSEQRWPLMQKMVQKEGWFPVTNFWPVPVGSNPFGIDGYKTMAHEVAERQRAAPPTVVVVPTCRGDMLFGLYSGFLEAQEAGLIDAIPKLVAVEPGARLERILLGDDYRTVFPVNANNMTSIDGGTATYQSVCALQRSDGHAVSVDSSDCRLAHQSLASSGLHVEMSSAASLAGLLEIQRQGRLRSEDRVVLIATSHGYKEALNCAVPAATRLCN